MANHTSSLLNPPHYAALLVASEKLGWPLSFRTDLTTHDRYWCARHDASVPFAWMVTAGSTHLYACDYRDGVGHRGYELPGIVADNFGDENVRYFFWDGRALSEVRTAAELADWMLERNGLERVA